MLKTDLYSAIKSEDSEVHDSGTSQLGSQTGFGEIEMFCLCVFVGSQRMPSSVLPNCRQPTSHCKLPSTTTRYSLRPLSAGSATKLKLTPWADCIVHLREVWSLPWWRTLAGHCPIRLSVRRCQPPLTRWRSVWCITTLGWLSWLRHRLCAGSTGVSFIVSSCKCSAVFGRLWTHGRWPLNSCT